MPRRGTRRTIAPGIYEDRTGYEVQVRGGRGRGNSKRFPQSDDRETDYLRMRRWQLRRETELAQLGATTQTPVSTADSLKTDVPRYLATLAGRKRRDTETLLDHWLKTPLAQLPRRDITPLMLRTAIAQWQTAGAAASTINHRLGALRALYRVLDENDLNAPNPTLKIVKLAEPEASPREIPRAFVEAVFAAMPDRGRPTKDEPRPTINKTKLRLRVIATTGLPHKQVGRLERQHVDWSRKAVYVTPRRKGKGVKGKWLPLTPDAVRAIRALFEKGADGPFDPSAAARAWHRAVAHVKAQYAKERKRLPDLPPKLKPYDLRHTFLTVAFRHSKNIRAVQELALHADPRMTERYMVGAVSDATREAVETVIAGTRSAGTRKSGRKS